MLRERLGPTIDKALTPKACTNIMTGIGKYIDKNSEILMTLNLTNRYSFGDADRDLIYSNIGVPQEVMVEEVNKAKAIPKNNKIKSNPFYCACILTMNTLIKQKKECEYECFEDVYNIDGEDEIISKIDARMQLQTIKKHLNEREVKILYQHAKGYSCREIAQKMHCSKNAVTKITQKVQFIFS